MTDSTAIQIIDDEFVEFDIEIYRVDRDASVDAYVVLKINEAETYMSLEEAKGIGSMLIDVATKENSDVIS